VFPFKSLIYIGEFCCLFSIWPWLWKPFFVGLFPLLTGKTLLYWVIGFAKIKGLWLGCFVKTSLFPCWGELPLLYLYSWLAMVTPKPNFCAFFGMLKEGLTYFFACFNFYSSKNFCIDPIFFGLLLSLYDYDKFLTFFITSGNVAVVDLFANYSILSSTSKKGWFIIYWI